MNPLFENGGQKEHRPWMYDDETYEIYRTYMWLHEELRPFYYSRGNDAYDNGERRVERRSSATAAPSVRPTRYLIFCYRQTKGGRGRGACGVASQKRRS